MLKAGQDGRIWRVEDEESDQISRVGNVQQSDSVGFLLSLDCMGRANGLRTESKDGAWSERRFRRG